MNLLNTPRFLIVFFLFTLLGPFSHAVEIPYETCNWKNQAWTERLVTEHLDLQSEADCPDMNCATEVHTPYGPDQINTLDPAKKALQIPPECFFASAVRSVEKEPAKQKDKHNKPTDYPNYYYCSSMQDRKPKILMDPLVDPDTEKTIIDPKTGKPRRLYPRAPCLNEDYIKMTHRAFHEIADCFDFSHKDRKNFFKLLNHESSFILNQKSNTSARCYGQLTQATLTEINKRIYISSNLDPGFKSRIYNNFASKCPNLLSQVQIPKKIKERASPKTLGRGAVKAFDSDFEGVLTAGKKMICQLTQDPYTCFFYSMYNMKKNQIQLENTINTYSDNDREANAWPSLADRSGESPKSQEFKKVYTDFKLPLEKNEMLIIRGPVTINGTNKERSWLMGNGKEVYDTLFGKGRVSSYNIEDLEVKKVTVFDFDEKSKADLLYQAYNGGSSIVSSKLSAYIIHQRSKMAEGTTCLKCKTNSTFRENNKWHCQSFINNYCPKRASLMETKQPIAFNVEDFSKKIKMDGEPANMPSQVAKNHRYLNDSSKNPKNPNPLTNHLHELRGVDPDNEEKRPQRSKSAEERAIDKFVRSIKGRCP